MGATDHQTSVTRKTGSCGKSVTASTTTGWQFPSPNLSPQARQEADGHAQRGEGLKTMRLELRMFHLNTAEADADQSRVDAHFLVPLPAIGTRSLHRMMRGEVR